jgi:adenosyl cobinamide kinase/adenosyl cobinamide phosphate guanylyltransferase
VIVLVLGGARSGKSALAEQRVLASAGPLTFVATGQAVAADGEIDLDMSERIAAHQTRRDPRFETIEAGPDLAATLRDAPEQPTLIDALGTWVAAHPDFAAPAFQPRIDDLIDALRSWADEAAVVVIVSDEVGMGVHPETDVGRQFRDVLGDLNQRVATLADEVVLIVAGRALRLETFESWGQP